MRTVFYVVGLVSSLAFCASAFAAGPRNVAPQPTQQITFEAVQEEIPEVRLSAGGIPYVAQIPEFNLSDGEQFYSVDTRGQRIFFTVDPELQTRAAEILRHFDVPWGALVALDPRTGRVLALSSHVRATEDAPQDLVTRATFPAASLFKMITTSAAVERSGLRGFNTVSFRGGNYTLERSNYLPDSRKDRRSMTLADALGRSVNPVFARVAVEHLSPNALFQYAVNFGFNSALPFEAPVQRSLYSAPADTYEFSRTAAGFGEVKISPLHAALMTAAIANDGRMMRPYFIDHITDEQGVARYWARTQEMRRPILPATAEQVLNMMRATTAVETAKRHFTGGSLHGISVAGKTGTLKGDDPKGLYHWFVAAAPVEKPEVVVAALVIESAPTRVNGTGIGKYFLEAYFADRSGAPLPSLKAQSVRMAARGNAKKRRPA
jgi:penicillin-binding protein A